MEQTPVQIAKTPLEKARKEYHDATVEMATIDAKLIDVSASLEELKVQHGTSIERVNKARELLVEARSPALAHRAAEHAIAGGLAAEQVDRDRMITWLVERADCIQDEAPGLASPGMIWVRPAAREIVHLGYDGLWKPLDDFTADLRKLMTTEEILQVKSDPRWDTAA